MKFKMRGEVFCNAFADDVGLVLKDRRSSLGPLAGFLKDFGDTSGMQVNREGVLSAGEDMTEVRKELQEHCPEWAEMPPGRVAKYLGFYIEDINRPKQWQEVCEKMMDTSAGWDWQTGGGVHFASVIYNTYLA